VTIYLTLYREDEREIRNIITIQLKLLQSLLVTFGAYTFAFSY